MKVKTKSYLSPAMATAFGERGFLQNSSHGTKSNNFFSPPNFFMLRLMNIFNFGPPSSQKCFFGACRLPTQFFCVFSVHFLIFLFHLLLLFLLTLCCVVVSYFLNSKHVFRFCVFFRSDRRWQGKCQYESLHRQYDQNKFSTIYKLEENLYINSALSRKSIKKGVHKSFKRFFRQHFPQVFYLTSVLNYIWEGNVCLTCIPPSSFALQINIIQKISNQNQTLPFGCYTWW